MKSYSLLKTVPLRHCTVLHNCSLYSNYLEQVLGRTPNWQDREICFSISNNRWELRKLKYKAQPPDVFFSFFIISFGLSRYVIAFIFLLLFFYLELSGFSIYFLVFIF